MKKYNLLMLLPLLLVSCNSNNNSSTVESETSLSTTTEKINTTDKISVSKEIKESVDINLNNKEELGLAGLKNLEPYFKKYDDITLSVGSLDLALGGLFSVSCKQSVEMEKFGFTSNPIYDTRKLLEAFNWSYSDESCYIKSSVLHQQVGSRYKFKEDKINELKNELQDVVVSDNSTFKSDAEKLLAERTGLNIELPVEDSLDSTAIVYGALTMRDSFKVTQKEENNVFYLKDGNETTVKSMPLKGNHLEYYETDSYQMCKIEIRETNLVFILPKDNIDIDSIDITDAYTKFKKESKKYEINGYLPYFHLQTTEDLTEILETKAPYWGDLLDNDESLSVRLIIQANDFTFFKDGASGQSVTTIIGAGAAQPFGYATFEVNRPFYAISEYNDYPLFVNKISNPTI